MTKNSAVFLLLLAIVLLTSAGARENSAWSPYDEASAKAEMLSQTAEPDHLVPYVYFEAPPGDIRSMIRGPNARFDCLSWYRVQPSFSDSKSWCLYDKDGKYFIKSWSIPGRNDSKPSTQSSRQIVPVSISKELALLIHGIWINALLETRYPKWNPGSTDGVFHYFRAFVPSTYLELYGATDSPSAELPPKWMTDSALKIMNFLSTKNADEKGLISYLNVQRERLFTYYQGAQGGGETANGAAHQPAPVNRQIVSLR